jgi:hypothetical protein
MLPQQHLEDGCLFIISSCATGFASADSSADADLKTHWQSQWHTSSTGEKPELPHRHFLVSCCSKVIETEDRKGREGLDEIVAIPFDRRASDVSSLAGEGRGTWCYDFCFNL